MIGRRARFTVLARSVSSSMALSSAVPRGQDGIGGAPSAVWRRVLKLRDSRDRQQLSAYRCAHVGGQDGSM